MKPSIIFIITSDPRNSPRPAEAFRIAAGVAVWQKAEVSVYLRGAAVQALSEGADELVDEESFTRYLPMMSEFGRLIYVQQGALLLREVGRATLPFEEIDDQKLADLSAGCSYVVRF